MTPPPWRHVHLTGVGGVGMAGLAHILADLGVRVTGTDEKDSDMLQSLRLRGMDVQTGHDAAQVADADTLVYSSAVSEANPERRMAVSCDIPTLRRGDFLAQLAELFPNVVAVAGSHGKTTTTAMLAHIMQRCGMEPGFLVGGRIDGWARSACVGKGEVLITEVDESDGTQALMRCSHAIIVNIEDDHCWSVGGMEALERCFAEFADRADHVIAWSCEASDRLLAEHPHVHLLSRQDMPDGLALPFAGEHNRVNATLALEAALQLGIDRTDALAALTTFPGVVRRLTEHLVSSVGAVALVEDYAHHPTELRAALAALREHYPAHRLLVVFQPHRHERVRRYAGAFAKELSQADEVIVFRPFAAWTDDDGLADPEEIARGIAGVPSRYWDGPIETLSGAVANRARACRSPLVVAVIGAGDVGALVPLLRSELSRLCSERLESFLRSSHAAPVTRTRAWSRLTTLGVGGDAPVLVEPRTEDELSDVLRRARNHAIPVQVLGMGSNILGGDQCDPHVFLRLRQGVFRDVRRGDAHSVEGGAGVTLRELTDRLSAMGLGHEALPALCWIPGTLGGAVRMNAGSHGHCMSELVERIGGFRLGGDTWAAAGKSLAWTYRASAVPEDVIITRVWIRVVEIDDTDAYRDRIREHGARRADEQPKGRSAGRVFRNPPDDSAGRLLDACGWIDRREGSFHFSGKHANFLLSDGGGSEEGFLSLLLAAQADVFRKEGVVLHPEIVAVSPQTTARIKSQTTALEFERDRSQQPKRVGTGE